MLPGIDVQDCACFPPSFRSFRDFRLSAAAIMATLETDFEIKICDRRSNEPSSKKLCSIELNLEGHWHHTNTVTLENRAAFLAICSG